MIRRGCRGWLMSIYETHRSTDRCPTGISTKACALTAFITTPSLVVGVSSVTSSRTDGTVSSPLTVGVFSAGSSVATSSGWSSASMGRHVLVGLLAFHLLICPLVYRRLVLGFIALLPNVAALLGIGWDVGSSRSLISVVAILGWDEE